MTIRVLEDNKLYHEAADTFAEISRASVQDHGEFMVALSGGTTPRALYNLMARDYKHNVPWTKTQVFFSDERCFPPDHPDSNFRMINESLIRGVGLPQKNIHRMRGEDEPVTAARKYASELKQAFKTSGTPRFNLILLGIGDDCHTASLFPGAKALGMSLEPAVSVYVPKHKAHRITLTPPVLLSAERIMVLVIGENKAGPLKRALEDDYDPAKCPAQILRKADGHVTWLVSTSAALQLRDH